jgi:hypothetical protein
LAGLAGLALAVQVALMGLLFTSLARAWLAFDRAPAHSQPIASDERVASRADRALPRDAPGSAGVQRPRAVLQPAPALRAFRATPRRELVDAGAATRSQRPASASESAIGRLLLLDVRADATGSSVIVAGLDLAAPRELVLWQVNEERRRAAPLAWTSSRADGVFELPRLLLPTRAVRLAVTEADGDPFVAGSAALLDVEALAPQPPHAWIDLAPADADGDAEGGRAQLRVAPDSVAYALVLGDATGRELGRLAIPAAIDPRRAPRPLRFEIEERPLQIARERADGRRSAWSAVPLRRLAVPDLLEVEKSERIEEGAKTVEETR